MRKLLAVCLVSLIGLFASAAAHAAVDLEVSLNTSSRGSISGPAETETYRFPATAGTVLAVTVAGKGMDLALALEDPSGKDVPLTSEPGFKDAGKKVSLKKKSMFHLYLNQMPLPLMRIPLPRATY